VRADPAPRTLASQLERDRLRSRARRLELVVAALQARARAYDEPPVPLVHSLAGFRRERDELRTRLKWDGSPREQPANGSFE
jgi:hypothetical protein